MFSKDIIIDTNDPNDLHAQQYQKGNVRIVLPADLTKEPLISIPSGAKIEINFNDPKVQAWFAARIEFVNQNKEV